MGSAPGWRRAGARRRSRAGARRGASASPSPSPRSTGAADGGTVPGRRADRAGRGAQRRPGGGAPYSDAPPRTAVAGQFGGPTATGTDRTTVPVHRGGPQSFAAAPEGTLAPPV